MFAVELTRRPPLVMIRLLRMEVLEPPRLTAPALVTSALPTPFGLPPSMVKTLPVAAPVPTVIPFAALFQTGLARIVSVLLEEPLPTKLGPPLAVNVWLLMS